MSEELYEFYKANEDFKRYVDIWCRVRDMSIFQAFTIKIVREYAEWIKNK